MKYISATAHLYAIARRSPHGERGLKSENPVAQLVSDAYNFLVRLRAIGEHNNSVSLGAGDKDVAAQQADAGFAVCVIGELHE